MIDFIAKGKQTICGEAKTAPDWSRYPTDFLRVRIVLKVLELMGFDNTPAMVEYRELWDLYSSSMVQAYTDDVPVIVEEVLQGEHVVLGNKSIMEVFTFTTDRQDDLDDLVENFPGVRSNEVKLADPD